MRSPEQLKGWARNVAAEKHLRAQEILQMFMFERLRNDWRLRRIRKISFSREDF